MEASQEIGVNSSADSALSKAINYPGKVVTKLRDSSGSVHSVLVDIGNGKVGRLPIGELRGTPDQQKRRPLFRNDPLLVRVTRENPRNGRFELSERAVPMFVYSSYWGTWSRVLSDSHPQGPYIEVNLTPINGWDSEGMKRVAPIRIRAHCTSRGAKDQIVTELPTEVVAQMLEHLGLELTERLLNEDILSLIDWDLYRKKDNGGANLEDIRLITQSIP